MITATGYSKDPNIVPEGIAITFGKEMMDNNAEIIPGSRGTHMRKPILT